MLQEKYLQKRFGNPCNHDTILRMCDGRPKTRLSTVTILYYIEKQHTHIITN